MPRPPAQPSPAGPSRTRPSRSCVLLILDGWGWRPEAAGNALAAARTPVWDRLWARCPRLLLEASGSAVGLPAGQMGNSEVGHLNLGAGRVVYQEFTRVQRAVADGSFYRNPTLVEAVRRAADAGRAVHVLGLLSPGGVHSHEAHIQAMLRLAAAQGARRLYLHAFLDGRDTPPRSAAPSLEAVAALFRELGVGRVASLVGRYYAMDRDHRWPRIQAAYELIAHGRAAHAAPDPLAALEAAYARGEGDEFVAPTAVAPPGERPVAVEDGDAVILMNFRSDRARQLTRAFTEEGFDGFPRGRAPRLGAFVTLTEYDARFGLPVAFPPERLRRVLGEHLALSGLRQLRLAETEKYAHVTFFLNGGVEEPFPGEERVLVPSPEVATYDRRPEMSAPEVTRRLCAALEEGRHALLVCNLANPDMVGHTGSFAAAVRAVEAVDACLGRIAEAARRAGAELLVTADHGNVEQMHDPATGQPHTAHTANPVPFLHLGRPAQTTTHRGILADVAPTVLRLLDLEVPEEMSGRPLLRPLDQGPA